MFNVCVYLPSYAFPNGGNVDLTDSLLELIVEGISHNHNTMDTDGDADGSNTFPTFNEETLEDLHPPEENVIDFALYTRVQVEHNYYHFTPDIKTHVLSVVSPPPDFC